MIDLVITNMMCRYNFPYNSAIATLKDQTTYLDLGHFSSQKYKYKYFHELNILFSLNLFI